ISFESKGSGVYRIEASTAGHIKKEISKRLANTIKTLKTLESRKTELLKDSKANLQEKQYKVIEDKYISNNELTQPIYAASYKYICAKKTYLESEKEVVKQLEKEYNKYFQNNSALSIDAFLNDVKEIKGINVLISRLDNAEMGNLKDLVDRLSDKLGESLIMFANVDNGKIVFICKSSSKVLNAGKLVKLAATVTGGNGGGRPDFAQAGGRDISKINEAFEKVLEEIGK
ncbi:MAG: DHHA1 domain-containing protein, partial [Bacilli bacterium]